MKDWYTEGRPGTREQWRERSYAMETALLQVRVLLDMERPQEARRVVYEALGRTRADKG